MQAASTVEPTEPAPLQEAGPPPSSRTWARAIEDIKAGTRSRALWSHLGWQDIKQRYRRSVIGPFWITISQAVIALGLGLLYSQLFGLPIATFLPYILTGFIVWGFISGCLTEGMRTFIANEGMIKQMPAPLTVYALRTVWRQVLMFAHSIIVYVVMIIIFLGSLDKPYDVQNGPCGAETHVCHPGLGWNIISAIPGFVLLAINAGWITLTIGVISTRFRDIPQLIDSLIQLLFYLTPIVWPIDALYAGGSRDSVSWALPIIQLNPLYHFVQIVRAPLIGQHVSINSWFVVIGFTIVGWALALLVMRNYRARVSYWV